ncbi:DMT family transporter [Oceanomicrobium pacificus]|uniref:EamA family transporter n=1 Tax=Oceanomicrobium pacificus TaxID=2692916 RepID=A0A6B0TND6_9RHOB|nr:DMT family transporter [Oceanomicrobium pacificus]MXU64099.1 EamA family transporter [Oceanomicrobium pacificus]
MELWIPITIAAAFFQNLRFVLQKILKGQLSTLGATWSRFLYAAPLAVLFLIGMITIGGYAMPGLNGRFFAFALTGGLAQIVATSLVVYLFGLRNFAVGITLKKTETVQAAIIGAVVLGDRVGTAGIFAIIVSLVGVILLSGPSERPGLRHMFSRSALVGLAAGAIFGVSGIGYRGAALALDGGDSFIRAAVTLAFVTTAQTIGMFFWMQWREPGQARKVLSVWPKASLVGLTGMLGSLGWFTAMAMQNVAYVKALGQIELVFSIAASYLFFGERISRNEWFGMALILSAILILIGLKAPG